MPDKKYLDQEGLKYLWSRTNMQDYPNNEVLMGVINAIDETKQDKITGAASTITFSNLSADRALVSNSSGKVSTSEVTSTELKYLKGVTQPIQEKIDAFSQSIFLAMPGALQWDGAIGDKAYITIDSGSDPMTLVHISDEYPNITSLFGEDGPTSALIGITMLEEFEAMEVPMTVTDDGGIIINEMFIIAPRDNYIMNEIVFPKKGVYTMAMSVKALGLPYDFSIIYGSALYIMGHVFKSENESASKYFETITSRSIEEVGDTLTWDGNIDGRVHFEFVIAEGKAVIVKISDTILTKDDLAQGFSASMNINGTIQNEVVSGEEAQAMFQEDGFAELLGCFVVPYDRYNTDMFIFPEAGIYFVHTMIPTFGEQRYESITVPGYNFTKINASFQEVIKTEHLPEALRFGNITTRTENSTTETLGDTITWDGVSGDNIGAAFGVTLVKKADFNMTLEELSAATITLTNSEGATITAIVNIYDNVAEIEDGSGYKYIYVTTVDNYMLEGILNLPTAGFYFMNDGGPYCTSLTIDGHVFTNTTTTVTEETNLVKIDPKYLPDDIGGVTSWNELEDKPFGETYSDTLTWDGNTDGLISVPLADDVSLYRISDVSLTEADFINGGSMSMNDGQTADFTSFDDVYEGDNFAVFFGEIVWILFEGNPMAAPTGVYFIKVVDGSNSIYPTSFTINGNNKFLSSIQKIDKKYLPSDDSKANLQHISNKGSGILYYKLGTMVADNASNYGNITISGRLGGWEQSNSANFDIMMLNRSSARDGNTITATVSASGEVETALTKCDIVVYRQSDTSEIVYLKLDGYWLYDFDWSTYQHSISYSATNVTPTGTLVWSLSGAPKTILDAKGNLKATSFVGTATKAEKDISGNDFQRVFCSMLPYGNEIAANSNLNTIDFVKVGNYYCPSDKAAQTLSNCPVQNAFMLQVYSPLSKTLDNENSNTYVYRIRKLMTYTGVEYIQYCYSGSNAGSFTHGSWKKILKDEDVTLSNLGAASVNHNHSGATIGPTSLELNQNGSLLNFGGFIDFHYYDSNGKPTNASGTVVTTSPDYTSRIIEKTAGTITIEGNLAITSQTPGTSLVRSSRLVTSDTNPTVNGAICWTYE